MKCFCCDREVGVARKVKIRRLTECPAPAGVAPKQDPAYLSYMEQTAYRWGVVCPACYLCLDNEVGGQIIAGESFTIAAVSRYDRARCITEKGYRRWQGREADKLFSSPKARRWTR
jgi:hypothetical protein